MNTIYNSSNEIVSTIWNGVVWCKKTGNRLGEHYQGKIYDDKIQMIAFIDGDKVLSPSGKELGFMKGNDLYVNGKIVGKYIGEKYAGAAAIAIIFN